MLECNGQAAEQCPENWSYVGNCPLPVCDPGGCEDGAPLREYIKCRLNLISNAFLETWREGDILFLGDSNTDILTAYDFFPLLPRAFNAAVLGSRICDTQYALETVRSWLYILGRIGTSQVPSAVVIMVGTNDLIRDVNGMDNQFTAATASNYLQLFEQLASFAQGYRKTRIVVRSVLPGVPAYSSCCSDGYVPDAAAFNQAVVQANSFLEKLCEDSSFTFLSSYNLFWNRESNVLRTELYRGGIWFNPCTESQFSDEIHLGCSGQTIALSQLVDLLYGKLPAPSGKISSLFPVPSAAPLKSRLPIGSQMNFRYAHYTADAGEKLQLEVGASSCKYAAAFIVGAKGGGPAVENFSDSGEPATIRLENSSNDPMEIVFCLGLDRQFSGRYILTTAK